MARTISELSPGTIIWCNTTLSGTDAATPFIVLGASQQGNSTLIMQQFVYEVGQMESQNVADTYSGSKMDTYLTSTDTTGYRMKYLSEAFRNCLISTTVEAYAVSSDSVLTLSRDIFLASETEVVTSAATHTEGISYLSALKTATGETDDANARIAYNVAGNSRTWWLRSPSSATAFNTVYYGRIYGFPCTDRYSIRPIYSIANGTLVSDDGAETIYLFPDAEKPYRELDIEISMGQCAKQPKMARVVANVEKATESIIKATNNYKDANPVWETVSADGIVTFANETKTTDNWELGVKIYAKSQDKAEVTEPVMTVSYETTDVPNSGGNTTDNSLGITSATVGQIAKISAVDDNGKPTASEAIDLPSGGSGNLMTLAESVTLTNSDSVSSMTSNAYPEAKEMFIHMYSFTKLNGEEVTTSSSTRVFTADYKEEEYNFGRCSGDVGNSIGSTSSGQHVYLYVKRLFDGAITGKVFSPPNIDTWSNVYNNVPGKGIPRIQLKSTDNRTFEAGTTLEVWIK